MRVALCLALSLAAYGNSFPGEPVFDDVPLLVENDCHRGLSKVPAALAVWRQTICNVRPLRFASFAIDYTLYGEAWWGYHLTNALLHGLVASLLWLLLLRLGVTRQVSALCALLFVLHPVNTEAVAYLSGRRDLLAALFCLVATLGLFSRRRSLQLGLSLAAFLAALLCYQGAAALPAALILLLWTRRRSESDRPRWIAVATMFVIAIGFAWWTASTRGLSDKHGLWGGGLSAHLGTVLAVHLRYLKLLVLPVDMQADYSPEGFALARSLFDGRALLMLGLLIAGLVGWIRVAAWRRPLIVAAVYVALLLPASQIVIHHELLAEHRLYLASACYCLALAAAIVALTRRLKPRFGCLLFGAIACGYLALTLSRNLDWRDSESLWRATVAQAPRCARAQANLGAVLAQQGQLQPAIAHFRRALALRPELCDARINLGQALFDSGQREPGLREVARGVDCMPTPKRKRQLLRLQRRLAGNKPRG